MKESIENRISKLELKLIEQDHRLIPSILNYFRANSREAKIKSIKAILYIFLSGSTVTAIGISITAIAGIFIAIKANTLLENQNFLIENQTYLLESQRRSSLVFELSSILDEVDEELDEIDKLRIKELGHAFSRANYDISGRLSGRIIAISNSLRPYKYFNDNGKLSELISPERSQLLLSLLESKISLGEIFINSNFRFCELNNRNFNTKNLASINLSNSILKNCGFYQTNLVYSKLENVDFENCDFRFSKLFEAKMDSTNLKGANLNNAYMTSVSNLSGSNLENIILDSIFVQSKTWMEEFKKLDNCPEKILKSKFEVISNRTLRRPFTGYYWTKSQKTFDSEGELIYDSLKDTTTIIIYKIRKIKNDS